MEAKKTRYIIPLVILFMAGYVFGQMKVPGKLFIPTAGGTKSYQAVIAITRTEIVIECREKIFQPFNEFNAPKHGKVKVKTAELYGIELYENKIHIFARDSFFHRYRNIFIRGWVIRSIHDGPREKWAIVFITDNLDGIGAAGEKLVESINKQCRRRIER